MSIACFKSSTTLSISCFVVALPTLRRIAQTATSGSTPTANRMGEALKYAVF